MKIKITEPVIIVLFLSCMWLTGCVGLDVAPTDKFTDPTYWTSEDKAHSVLNMGYRQMFGAAEYYNNEILSDNVYQGYGTSSEKTIANGRADASNGRFQSEWTDCYAGIKTCHTFLNNVHRITDMDAQLEERMKAEIRFIRAFLYLRLTNWFGDVPFFTQDITMETAKTISRTKQSVILEWIHQELNEIAEILPTKQQYRITDRGRITRGAAVALNARAYLYENNWEKVKEYCEKLINTTDYGTYGLFPSYEELFWVINEYNQEIILDIQYVPIHRTWSELSTFAPLSTEASFCKASPTQDLVDSYLMKDGRKWTENDPAYINRDPRFAATIVYDGYIWTDRDGSQYEIVIHPDHLDTSGKKSNKYIGQGSTHTPTGYYYRKLCDPNPAAYTKGWESNINIPIIRYADILLMYAEAMNELGQMDEPVWDMTIRALRERAGFDNTHEARGFVVSDPSELREIIRNERRCELALEGLRVFDIRRWETAETVLRTQPRGGKFEKIGGVYQNITLPAGNFSRNRDYLWGIPRAERNLNPNLTQNPGY